MPSLRAWKRNLQRRHPEIVTSIQRRYEAAVSRENLLRRSYDQQKGTTTQQTRDQIDLIAITSEIGNRQAISKYSATEATGISGNIRR